MGAQQMFLNSAYSMKVVAMEKRLYHTIDYDLISMYYDVNIDIGLLNSIIKQYASKR